MRRSSRRDAGGFDGHLSLQGGEQKSLDGKW
jgi:hypothetical protein